MFFQAEDGIRDVERSRGLGDVYKRQILQNLHHLDTGTAFVLMQLTKKLQQLGASILLMCVFFFNLKNIFLN